MNKQQVRVGVISAGGWGTALAIAANRAGSKAMLYTANNNVLESIVQKRSNDTYLPGIFIEPSILVTNSLAEVCDNDIIILSVPSQYVRSTCIGLSDHIEESKPIVIATKGIERVSLSLMSDVLAVVLPKNPVAILSGPNFASEVGRGLPTATTIACEDKNLANQLVFSLGGKYFRPYHTDDIIGTQIGGAVKNVIAIACGIALGRGFGENARAALITRGINEMARLCIAVGGRQETLMGLSGFGDLVLTCGSAVSRNMSLGLEIGQQKKSVKVILSNRQKQLAEGVMTSESVAELATKMGVSMPICKMVRDVVGEIIPVDKAIQLLLERQFVSETGK